MDYQEIDIAMSEAFKNGIEAFNDGKTKYDNDYEPGSLSFMSWDAGFKTAEKRDDE